MYHCDEARPQLSSSSTLVVKAVSGNWFNNDVKTSWSSFLLDNRQFLSNAWRLAGQIRRLRFHARISNESAARLAAVAKLQGQHPILAELNLFPLMAGADGRWLGGLMKRGLLEEFQVTAEGN